MNEVQKLELLQRGSVTACVGATLCIGRRTGCGEEYSLGRVLLRGAEKDRDEVAKNDDGLTVRKLGFSDKM